MGSGEDWIGVAHARDQRGSGPTIDALLQMASLEVDEIGLTIERLKGALGAYLEALPPDLHPGCREEFQAFDLITQRLRAVAGVVGLVRPQLGPYGGVREALEILSGAAHL